MILAGALVVETSAHAYQIYFSCDKDRHATFSMSPAQLKELASRSHSEASLCQDILACQNEFKTVTQLLRDSSETIAEAKFDAEVAHRHQQCFWLGLWQEFSQ